MNKYMPFHTLKDLRPFGFEPLTGEACGLSLRILCDVNAKGASIFKSAYGLPQESILAHSYNNYVDGVKAIGSVMLHSDSVFILAAVGLIMHGGYAVWVCQQETSYGSKENFILGLCESLSEEESLMLQKMYGAWSKRSRSTMPGNGLRNQHMMSGRIE